MGLLRLFKTRLADHSAERVGKVRMLTSLRYVSGNVFLAFVAGLLLLAPSARPAVAGEGAKELYSSVAVVSGRGDANRAIGFATCLSNVLVKVSGDPSLDQVAGLDSLKAKAGDLVLSFGYRDFYAGRPLHDEQGSYDRPHYLTVFFDPAKVDAVLQSVGRAPWRGHRPTVALALSVNGRKSKFVLTSDDDVGESAAMREAVAAASAKLGIPVLIPTRKLLKGLGIGANTIPTADGALLQTLASGTRQDLGLAGTLDWSDVALGWVVHWRLADHGRVVDWTVEGVNFDEAFRNAVKGVAKIASGNGKP